MFLHVVWNRAETEFEQLHKRSRPCPHLTGIPGLRKGYDKEFPPVQQALNMVLRSCGPAVLRPGSPPGEAGRAASAQTSAGWRWWTRAECASFTVQVSPGAMVFGVPSTLTSIGSAEPSESLSSTSSWLIETTMGWLR